VKTLVIWLYLFFILLKSSKSNTQVSNSNIQHYSAKATKVLWYFIYNQLKRLIILQNIQIEDIQNIGFWKDAMKYMLAQIDHESQKKKKIFMIPKSNGIRLSTKYIPQI